MILAKPFAIAAGALPVGGSSYQITGSKFFLLAASEPLFVKLFRGSELVGDFTGFNGGLEAGPYCEPFTSFALATASGAAGNAIIGVGDDDMAYDPAAGTLNFNNAAANLLASPQPALVSTPAQQSLNSQNFSIIEAFVASAGNAANLAIGNNGNPLGENLTVTEVLITNSSAAALPVSLGWGVGGGSGTIILPTNMNANGVASKLTTKWQQYNSVIPPFNVVKTVLVPANSQIIVDLSNAPIIVAQGASASFQMLAGTLDTAVTFEVHWKEG